MPSFLCFGSFCHDPRDDLVRVDVLGVGERVNVYDFVLRLAARAPSPDKVHIVAAGENGYRRRLDGGGDVLARGIVSDEFVTLCDKGRNLADGALYCELAV